MEYIVFVEMKYNEKEIIRRAVVEGLLTGQLQTSLKPSASHTATISSDSLLDLADCIVDAISEVACFE